MIFRLSQKLAKKLHEDTLPSSPLDENPYADWSAHLFTADRAQYIILTNTKSLYSVVMYGKEITDGCVLIDRALNTIREFMDADRQAFIYQRFISPASRSVRLAKALDRSVIGSINELVKFATFWLAEDDIAPHEVGFRLNDILLSALGHRKTDSYGKPKEAFKSLMENLGLPGGEVETP